MSTNNNVINAITIGNYDETIDECCNYRYWCFAFLNGCSPEEVIEHAPTEQDKVKLRERINYYNKRDVQFLYFVTLVFVSTFVGALFSFSGSEECTSVKKPMRNLVIWTSSFTMFMVEMRLYFFKMYIQNPLISIFRMHSSDAYDKFMNLMIVLLLLGLCGNFVAMFNFAYNYETLKSVISMCVLIGSSIVTTAWYKLIVRRMVRRAKEHNPIIATNAQCV